MGESLLWCWKTQPAVHWKSMLFKCFLSPSFRPLSCGADVSDQSPPSNPIMCLFPQSPFCQAVFDAVHPPHPSSFPSLFTHLLVFSSHTCPYHFKLLPCTLLAIYIPFIVPLSVIHCVMLRAYSGLIIYFPTGLGH